MIKVTMSTKKKCGMMSNTTKRGRQFLPVWEEEDNKSRITENNDVASNTFHHCLYPYWHCNLEDFINKQELITT
jgi:hypothetical protein